MATTSYFFVFGRTPQLAFKELLTFFPDAQKVAEDVAVLDLSDDTNINQVMDVLGGTTKIAKNVGVLPILDAQLSQFLLSDAHSVTFGVSVYGGSALPKTLLSDVKKELETAGYSARYISSKDGDALTSVAIDKEHAQELIAIRSNDQFLIGKTVAVQAYDTWSKRDYGRPQADAKSGMLPLKVARMIVNIGLATPYEARGERQKTIVDPFCGMGTILSEGYLMGSRVIGCDTAPHAVEGAKKNLAWISSQYPDTKGAVAKIFEGDAVHASDTFARESVHAIVTEPYMGSTDIANNQKKDPTHVKNIIKGLEKLYIGCLRDWHKILVPNGKIVIAWPAYAISGRTYFVKKVVDMCESLGYTIEDGPIEYSRPQATVKRMFYILRKI
jgi:tRNA G10  N-methylase Trm11